MEKTNNTIKNVEATKEVQKTLSGNKKRSQWKSTTIKASRLVDKSVEAIKEVPMEKFGEKIIEATKEGGRVIGAKGGKGKETENIPAPSAPCRG